MDKVLKILVAGATILTAASEILKEYNKYTSEKNSAQDTESNTVSETKE